MADITLVATMDTSGVEQGEKKIERSSVQISRAVARADTEFKRLDKQVNSNKISLQQYSDAVQKVNNDLAAFKAGQVQTGNMFTYLDRQMLGNTRSMNNFGVGVQQAGYQVGDFLVQVQSGTNAFVAFGQQATQLVGILPMFNPALVGLSAGLGIAIPLVTALGAYFSRTAQNAKDLETQIKSLTDQLENSIDYTGKFSKELAQLNDELTRVKFEDTFFGSLAKFRGPETFMENLIAGTKQLIPRLYETPEEAIDALGLNPRIITKEFFSEFERAFREADVGSLETQFEGFIKAIEMQGGFDSLTASGRQLVLQMYEMTQRAEEFSRTSDDIRWSLNYGGEAALELADEIGRAGVEALTLAGVDVESGVDAAAKAAAKLAANMGISLAAAQGLQALGATPDNRFMQLYNSGAFTGTPNVSGYQSPELHNLLDRINNPNAYGLGGGGGGAGGPSPVQQAQEYLEKIQREAEFKRTLVGLTDEQATQEERRNQILTQLNGYEEGLGEQYSERINQIIQMEAETRKLMEAEQQREQMMTSVQGHIESAFMSFVDGSKSVEDAFKSMLRNIILEIYQTKVAKPAANAIMDLLFSAKGNVFSGGAHVKAYADGGVVNRTTAFPMRGGVGIMGEAGPEAIMPLKRGKNGKLGVQMEGSSGDVVIHQNFNFSANGDDSVKRIIRGEIPRITEATKAAVVDAKRRGGSYGRSF